MAHSNSTTATRTRSLTTGVIVSSIFVITYVAAMFLPSALNLSQTASVIVVLMPVVAFAGFILAEVRLIRTLDEMQQRIQLEALAIAYPAAILMIMALGLLERVVELPKADLSYRHVWPFLCVFYFVGLAIARRRYQ